MPRSNGPFAHLDEASLHELAPHGVARAFPKNAVVVNEGDDSDSLYVLLAGRVKVFITGDDGREVVVNVVEAGDYFGELSLDSGVRSASVMTLAPCRFFIIPHGDVEGLLASSPAFAHDLIVKLIGSVRSLTGKVRDWR
jgi:CRP/FNR family cyclic AMP-dependent transcriptional regulator